TYEAELDFLVDREPDGPVFVSLPFNNPLYSLVLYGCGPALGGDQVTIRPSSITAHVVQDLLPIMEAPLSDAGVKVSRLSGREFISLAESHPTLSTLIFTGAWANAEALVRNYPIEKRLIYCGSGLAPFVVCHDALDHSTMTQLVELATASRLFNSGQDCLCSERFLVHTSLAGPFVAGLRDRLARVRLGPFGDQAADVVPLLAGLADRLESLSRVDGDWILPFKRDGDLVAPSLVVCDPSSPLMTAEKFGPMFTVTVFESDSDLERMLESDYRFGAIVCGSYHGPTLEGYPHVARGSSVIEAEAEDCHVPFGGRVRSGFVSLAGQEWDGPILYSVECTRAVNQPREDLKSEPASKGL
ncbi:MAG: putative oxidoreductase, partial [Aeromicrobium sp.]|nr:putative oxidoreductase [Aeromicrobium sp.]